MRLADISEFFTDCGGGVRTYALQKLEACARAGVEATLIAPGPADRIERRCGGRIVWVRGPALAVDGRYHSFRDRKAVYDVLDALKPDVVEGSSTWRGGRIAADWPGEATRALFLHQDPVAVYGHSLFGPSLGEARVDRLAAPFWTYLRRLAARFDAVAVSSPRFAARLAEFGVVADVVSPLGVERDVFAAARRNERLRAAMLAECGVDDPHAPLFVAVSRHHPEKRLFALFRAFDRFARERSAGLYVIGDGPLAGWVRKAAERRTGVAVVGHLSDRMDLAARVASADYFLHGGAAETFGLAVAEALCAGLPLVAPDRGGAADFAHPAWSETYRAGDPAACAAAMARLVARPREDLAAAARAGAQRVAAPTAHFDALLEAYRGLIAERRVRSAA